MTSRFSGVEDAAPDEIGSLIQAYKNDTDVNKVDLLVGDYKTEDGNIWVPPVVQKAEKLLAEDALNYNSLPTSGLKEFTIAATSLLLGEDNPAIKENRVLAIQSIGATGGLRVAAEFLHQSAGFNNIFVPSPTWARHHKVFANDFPHNCHTYRYWNNAIKRLDYKGMLEDLEKAPDGSIVLFHACAHNPTGVDPTQDQWKGIADLMERKKLFPIFDCAYQGLASGDIHKDSWSIRYFISRGFEVACGQSFSKTMGLYGERIGNLIVVLNDSSVVDKCRKQINRVIIGMYLTPPCHGAKVVAKVLNDPQLLQEWLDHVKEMFQRITKMRKTLKQKLLELSTPGSWDHITDQIGMYCYTGLSRDQVKYMMDKYHVYLQFNSRVNIPGLTMKNVDYVAKAISDTIVKFGDRR